MCLRRREKITPSVAETSADDIDVFIFNPETVDAYFNYIREKYTADLEKIFYSGCEGRVTMEDHLRFMAYKNTILELVEKIDEPVLENKYKTEFETLESIYKLKLVENYATGTIGIDKEVIDLVFRPVRILNEGAV
jgi:hypothetical protein